MDHMIMDTHGFLKFFFPREEDTGENPADLRGIPTSFLIFQKMPFLKWQIRATRRSGQPGVHLILSLDKVMSYSPKRKGRVWPPGRMTTFVSSGEKVCGSFPVLGVSGGKHTHNVHFLNTGCAA